MKRVYVQIHLADYSLEHPERCVARAERTGHLVNCKHYKQCYDDKEDIEVKVMIKVTDWWSGKQLSPLYMNASTFRAALEKLNLFPL